MRQQWMMCWTSPSECCLRHLSLISHWLLVTGTIWAAPALIECVLLPLPMFLLHCSLSQSKTQRYNHTQTNSRVCGLGFSTLWTSLNYLQVVDQYKINASQQLHKGQDMSEPKVILPWFPFWEICVLTAVSPCSVCSHSSAPAPHSPQPILAALGSSR